MNKDYPFYFTWTTQKDAQSHRLTNITNTTLELDDKEIIDLSSLSLQASFGLKNQVILNEIKKQIDDIPISTPKCVYQLKENVTKDLLSLINLDQRGKIFFTVSGAESIENAIKMARQIKNKTLIAARNDSYHGATLGALSLTGDWRNQEHKTIDEWTLRIPSPKDDFRAKKALQILESHKDDLTAICLETISGANGVITGDLDWWVNIQKFCKKNDIFLILDEVVCGFYRTSKFMASQIFSLEPDMICFSKAITGGSLPLGAVYTSSKIAQYYDENILSCGLTNYAYPLGLSALKGVLKVVNDSSFLTNLKKLEQLFFEELRQIEKNKVVNEIRVYGMLACIELIRPPAHNLLIENGIDCIIRDKNLILAPQLTLLESELKFSLKRLNNYLEKL